MSREMRARQALDAVLDLRSEIDFADSLMQLINCSSEPLYEALPADLKTAVAVNAFSLETSAGGFFQLVANTDRRTLDDIERGLQRIGAAEALRCFERVQERLAQAAAGSGIDDPSLALQRLDDASGGHAFDDLDSAYEKTGERVLELLRAYVFRRRESFSAEVAAIVL